MFEIKEEEEKATTIQVAVSLAVSQSVSRIQSPGYIEKNIKPHVCVCEEKNYNICYGCHLIRASISLITLNQNYSN